MLSDELNLTLKRAVQIATTYNHEYVTSEHLLISLIEDMDVAKLLKSLKINLSSIKKRLNIYLTDELSNITTKDAAAPKPTSSFQRLVQQAMLHLQAHEQTVISGLDVLAEFFVEQDSYAFLCLKESGLTRINIINFLKSHPVINTSTVFHNEQRSGKNETTIATLQLDTNNATEEDQAIEIIKQLKETQEKIQAAKQAEQPESSPTQELEKYCINLNTRAHDNVIDCLVGRQEEVQRTIEILCRRKKNNIILVGEPGVGKTAIAEGLAIRIAKKDVPEFLSDAMIYALDIAGLVAGTKFRGDFEDRIKNLLEALKQDKNAILFIDEIHTIIGAGSTNTNSMDASNLLKPALARGEIKCIGATTFKEYYNHFEKDMALVRRFQKIVVEEPDIPTSIEILKGIVSYYEKHHNVVYDISALVSAVSLSERYIHDRNLPDKAIDLIDEAGARAHINTSNTNNLLGSKKIITDKDIVSLISSVANIPQLEWGASDIGHLKELGAKLKKTIFGQDEAIEKLCDSIKLSKAGLRRPNRPIGCYMFAGPTGVGKTELAKQLATLNNMKLLKFDMSEFSEASAVSKLLGSAPGYVGFGQGAMLTDEIDKYPYSVVLFDEIEKANSEIFNLLLQIMDEGQITDSTGKNISFINTIIILTTNVAAEHSNMKNIGFGAKEVKKSSTGHDERSDLISQAFSPELCARLDHILFFNPISKVLQKIVTKSILELSQQLKDKNVTITVDNSVKKYLISQCGTKNNGARELGRIVDYHLKRPIAQEILFGKLKNGGSVAVTYTKRHDKLNFGFARANHAVNNEAEYS
jgi:ATP-dependent Clp protease ATP-binding subunit ClpA